MGTAWFAVCGVLIAVFQVAAAEESSCMPGFESELLIFKVTRKHLRPGTRLGRVGFTDCTDRTRFLFSTDDSRFVVQTDGVVMVKRQVVLHDGHRDFFIHSWDSQGQKLTVPAMVLYRGHHHRNDHHDGHESDTNDQTESSNATRQDAVDPKVPILRFPKSSPGLKRRKRDWVIPNIRIPENSRGPFPEGLNQIRSDKDKEKKIQYRITGPGADEPPVGLFTMDRDTGMLYITEALDREKQDKYVFQAHAEVVGGAKGEDPMDIVIIVIDQNDNKPIFEKSSYLAEVPEASQKGFEVIQVVATDADQPNTDNSDILYRIDRQEPALPNDNMFTINPKTGMIRVNIAELDREKTPQYTLHVQVADTKGEGLTGYTKVNIKVTDSNDHAPVFTEGPYAATIEENKVDAFVVRMIVKDDDDAHSPASNAKFKIIDGDPTNLFSVKTGTNKQEGIITTAKGLDFEKSRKHTLLVTVEKEGQFGTPSSSSTATVVVTVKDVYETLMFEPKERLVSKREDLAVNSSVVQFTASDPDCGVRWKVKYKVISDPAGWLNIDANTGEVTVKSQMDRESIFVKEEKYTALIAAYYDVQIPATVTGTLDIQLQDVNDNAPTIKEHKVIICTKNSATQLLTLTDEDGPGFSSPFSVSLHESAEAKWTARMDGTGTGVILTPVGELERGHHTVAMNVSDNQGMTQVCTVIATACDCSEEEVACREKPNLAVILRTTFVVLLLLGLIGVVVFTIYRSNRKWASHNNRTQASCMEDQQAVRMELIQ